VKAEKFIPSTKKEMKKLGWKQADIILLTGDAYIDSPFIGTAIIARILEAKGFKVAVISQPDINSGKDITRLGEPLLFWGVSAGSVDSMVSNYTASGKKRNRDDLTPGGINNKRPDLATIKYTNLIRQYFKDTAPVLLGGIEASLRRIPHYDFKSKKIRNSILFDSKADYILYGMSDHSIIEFANALQAKLPVSDIKGLCMISKELPEKYIPLPSFDEVKNNKEKFREMFLCFYKNKDFHTAKTLVQQNGNRYLIINPPPAPISTEELDFVYGLSYTRKVHPYDAAKGEVKDINTINHSITTHRGCYGECNFCAIAVHQGTIVTSRSQKSILNEAEKIASMPDFKGYITDLGGPTANMYEIECSKKIKSGPCKNKRCLFPETCNKLQPDHEKQIKLIEAVEKIKNVKKVFVSSGIRYDMILNDKKNGEKYLKKILRNNISGQMKIAPEHTDDKVLKLMGKPSSRLLIKFRQLFEKLKHNKLFLTYYFIAAYPGCTKKEMINLKKFCITELRINPEQVQIFTPTPSTLATMMYYTNKDLEDNKLFIPNAQAEKNDQKNILVNKKRDHYNKTNYNKKGSFHKHNPKK